MSLNGYGEALNDIADGQNALRNEVRALHSDVVDLHKEVQGIKSAMPRAQRWGAFLGATFAGFLAVVLNQCSIHL